MYITTFVERVQYIYICIYIHIYYCCWQKSKLKFFVQITWVCTFFNHNSNHPRMCVLSTLWGNVDKHSPFDIYVYIYTYSITMQPIVVICEAQWLLSRQNADAQQHKTHILCPFRHKRWRIVQVSYLFARMQRESHGNSAAAVPSRNALYGIRLRPF